MASTAAARFDAACRAKMRELHAETVEYYDSNAAASATPADLSVVWKRVVASTDVQAGVGARTYDGKAMCVVSIADLTAAPGARSYIYREDERWDILDVEIKDEYTYIFHMSQPDLQDTMPQRGRA